MCKADLEYCNTTGNKITKSFIKNLVNYTNNSNGENRGIA